MTFRLKTNVAVAGDPARDGHRSGLMVVLSAGTDLDSLSEYERRQLAPEHFVGVGEDDGASPDDWRDNERTTREVDQRAFLDEYVVTHVQPRED